MTPQAPTFRLVTTEPQLLELVPAWRELARACGQAGPMLDPCWLVTWWKHYGRGRTLACGVFEAEGRLVGLALFCLRMHVYKGVLRYRRLEFLGSSGNEPDALCSEYLDLIVRHGWEEIVAADCASRLLAGQFGAWDECLLEAMGSEAVASKVLRHLGAHGGRLEIDGAEQAPYVRLPDDWDTYLKALPKKRRQSLKYALRDFESWASAGYQIHRAEDARSLAEGMGHLVRLHGERWSKDNAAGAFAAKRFLAFQMDYAALALEAGHLDLVWITVGGEAVAVQYNLLGADKIYFYQSGRKIGVPKQVRLGIVMLIFVLQDAIAKGYREFDFLGGDSTYKRLLATDCRTLVNGRVARPTRTEQLLQSAKTALRSLRRVRQSMWPAPAVAGLLSRGKRKPAGVSTHTNGVSAPAGE